MPGLNISGLNIPGLNIPGLTFIVDPERLEKQCNIHRGLAIVSGSCQNHRDIQAVEFVLSPEPVKRSVNTKSGL